MRRLPAMIGVAVGLLIGAPLAVAASASHPTVRPGNSSGLQITSFHYPSDHTASRHWSFVDRELVVSPTAPLAVRANGLVSVTVSGLIRGGKAELRMLDAGHPMQAGPVVAQPATGGSSFSYTFTRFAATSPKCGRSLRLQWRSPSKRTLRLSRANIVVTYYPATQPSHSCT
jgi:hypothetical protein